MMSSSPSSGRAAKALESNPPTAGQAGDCHKPLVSIVLPAYNEAAILEKNLETLHTYLRSLEDEYRWEMILVNDGSVDSTGALLEAFAQNRQNVHVLHHRTNFGLGQALRFAFSRCRGDYVITLDVDLTYSPDHIRSLLDKIRRTGAKLVLASPYMKGGRVAGVPWLRRVLSVWANRFLSAAAKGSFSTLTGMVRAYDGRFLRALNLKSQGMDINPEVVHKAMVLRARIEEVPATLDWQACNLRASGRRSSMKVFRHILSVLLSGFLFRPVMFFILPGLFCFLLSLYADTWVLVHTVEHYRRLAMYPSLAARASAAVASAFAQAPHTFIIGGMTLMVAIQLISLGILALQGQHYFEEIFHLGTTIYRSSRADGKENA
jgi:glycosyltransferase involved in cell wall biosynthesis